MTVALHKRLTDVLHCHQFSKDNINILGVDLDPVLIQRCNDLRNGQDALTFKCCNVMDLTDRETINNFLIANQIKKFDIIFCFAVAMWIHLNNGDVGLCNFLQYISSIGDNLVLEEQSWKCYKNAQRRMKKLNCSPYEHFDHIKWKDNIVEEMQKFLVNECKMKFIATFGVTSWDRRITFYSKDSDCQ